jgi:hypothetical protein
MTLPRTPGGAQDLETIQTELDAFRVELATMRVELFAEVEDLWTEVVALRDAVLCPRCSTEGPPPARWPGDPRAADSRRAHTCGKGWAS